MLGPFDDDDDDDERDLSPEELNRSMIETARDIFGEEAAAQLAVLLAERRPN